MRRQFYGLAAALTAAIATLTAQTVTSRLTLVDKQQGVPVSVMTRGALQEIGTTNSVGQLLFDTSLLAGKPKINVRIEQCSADTDIALFPQSGPGSDEYNRCRQNCKCRRRPGAFIWGDDYTMSLGAKPFFETPKGLSLLGAGAVTTIAIAAKSGGGGSSSTTTPTTPVTPTPTPTPTPSPTPDFATIIGNYILTGVVQSTGGCSFGNFTGTLTVAGTAQSSTVTLIEKLTRAYAGTWTAQNTTWSPSVSGSGSIPGLGNYTGTITGQVNGTTFTGTEMLNFPCGTVKTALTGTKQ